MDLETLREFARKYTKAWCSQNPASVAGFFSKKGSLKINESDPAVGREAITEAARSFMTAFPDMIVAMDNVTVENNQIYYSWTLYGTNTGPGGSGKSVRISGYEEWKIGSDGLIAESLGHFDEKDYFHQLQFGCEE